MPTSHNALASKPSKEKIKLIAPPETVVLALEEKAFCVALKKDGTTICKEARNVSDFRSLIDPSAVVWIDYVVDDFKKEAQKISTSLGFNETLVKNLIKSQRSGYEDFVNEMGLLLPAIIVEGFKVELNPLLILIRKNVIVTLHTAETKRFFRLRKYADTLMRKLPKNKPLRDKITLLLIRIIDENNARNFDYLKEIEEQGDVLSEQLADPKTPRAMLGAYIHKMKHGLIVYLGGLWATIDALNGLRYGDAELLTNDPKILNRTTGLVADVNSHIGLAEHLSEVLASGLEVMQTIYNNQLQILNNRLALVVAYLTIIGTALLVPNTIATVVSSSMFEFTPVDLSWYLPFLVVSTLLATVMAWFIVKKMGLLPSKPDTS